MVKNIVFPIVLFLIANCSAQTKLKEYYYPFGTEREVKIYKYVNKKNPAFVEYWKVISIPETNELKTVSYNAELNVYNIIHEVITENGAELTAYSDFDLNRKGERTEIKSQVIDKDVYKWNGEKEYAYSVKFVNKYGRFDFKKKRKALGFEKIKVSGKEYMAAKFRDDYIILALDQGAEHRFYQYAYYAENIGMIKYKREIPIQHKTIELELVDILTEQEFEKIK